MISLPMEQQGHNDFTNESNSPTSDTPRFPGSAARLAVRAPCYADFLARFTRRAPDLQVTLFVVLNAGAAVMIATLRVHVLVGEEPP
ncbi:MAG: hypothetical protein ACREVE_09605 [Gammaproteobacteria bacterium]